MYFKRELFAPPNDVLATAIADGRRAFFVVDDGVSVAQPRLLDAIDRWIAAHGASIDVVAPPEIVAAGEGCKNDPLAVAELQRRFFELHRDRHAFVIVIGGGALLDMAGYAAATAHRGLLVVRVPTTPIVGRGLCLSEVLQRPAQR